MAATAPALASAKAAPTPVSPKPSGPATASSRGRAASDTLMAHSRPKPLAITVACSTSAVASSRRCAPRARAPADTTPPPIAPVDLCAGSSANGSSTAQPAREAVPCRAAGTVSTSCAATCNIDSPDVGASRKTASLGYDHVLSKRTDPYAVYMRGRMGTLSNGNSDAAGLRHRF